MSTLYRLLLTCLLMGTAACSVLPLPQEQPEPPETQRLTLNQTGFDDLPGWNGDDHAALLVPFVRSCDALEKKAGDEPFGIDERMGKNADWAAVCKDARLIRPGNQIEAKYFWESRFVPYRAENDLRPNGLFTGYYEPELNGRWTPEPGFQIPVHARPTDVVQIDLGDFRKELAGTQLAGRVEDGKVLPYYTRAEINAGALKGRELEILWVDDPIDLFFMHIQGSGRVRLADGSTLRLGYAGRNGHRYTSIGRELVAMGEMKLADVTAPAIREWLRVRPVAGAALMNKNESYVFFRTVEGDGPIGAQGVALTPGRSLAVDRAFIPLGVPIWLDTTDPTANNAPLRRAVIAQDTGSAIKGPVRGDVFWGFGEQAAQLAGLMKQRGEYYLLLPASAAPKN